MLILTLFLTGFVAREWIYNRVVTYKSIGARTDYPVTNALLIKKIESALGNHIEPDVDEIIDISLMITSSQLNFTPEDNDIDPNRLISSRTAHCIGYASYFATTCNYLLKKNGLHEQWIARPQIGQLYVLRSNVHQYLDSPFLKDHDFVIIQNRATGKILAVDPTVNDYFKINLVKYAE